jgi:hypothetical protein
MFIGTDRWHSSTEGANRVYYAPSSTTFLRGHGGNPFIFRNGADSDIGFINSSGNFHMYGYLHGQGAGGVFRFERFDSWVRLRDGGTTHVDFAAGQLYSHSQITGNTIVSANGITNNAGNIINYGAYFGLFYSVSMSNTDYLCIQNNTSLNTNTSNWIRVAHGSFTAFHRFYTDDVLYNNETDESIDLFKNNYMVRVVIATGKIKTVL